MATRIRAAALSLEDMAERGHPVGRGRRDLTTVPPYLIRYRIQSGIVEILTVRHSARRPLI